MPSASNERQIKERNDQMRRDRLTDEVVTKSLMSHKDGRRWIWLRLSEANLWQEDMQFDAGTMAYRKGQRNAGLRLLSDVTKFSPREYITMTEENTPVTLTEPPSEVETDYE